MVDIILTSGNYKVIDFQLIYDTDSFLHLDFYAEGLRIEPLVLFNNQSIIFIKKSYGYLLSPVETFNKYQEMFISTLKDFKFINLKTIEMIKSIRKVHLLSRQIEKYIFNGQDVQGKMINEYFKSIAIMMSYKRLSDECKPHIFSDKLSYYQKYKHDIKVTSYLMLFNNQLARLKGEKNNIDMLHNFIYRYAFLKDFNIETNELEKVQSLLGVLDSYNYKHIPYRKKSNYHLLDKGLTILRRVSWYEEMRHIYQLRSLRNFRLILEKRKLNIFKTDLKELLLTEGYGDDLELQIT